MADEMVVSYSDKPITEAQKAKDFEEHAKTYEAFMGWAKWGIIGNVIILIALYFIFIH